MELGLMGNFHILEVLELEEDRMWFQYQAKYEEIYNILCYIHEFIKMYLCISTRLRILNSCRRTLSDNKVHDTTLFKTYTHIYVYMYKITNVHALLQYINVHVNLHL